MLDALKEFFNNDITGQSIVDLLKVVLDKLFAFVTGKLD